MNKRFQFGYDVIVSTGLLLMFLLITSCQEKGIHHSEINQVFSVKKSDTGYDPGDLMYEDSIAFQSTNLPLAKYVYDPAQNLVGIEEYPSVRRGPTEIETAYKDTSGNVLSKYIYHLNDQLLKTKVEGYDGVSGDLLRYEELEYNDNNKLETRKIFNSNGELVTSYTMLYDVHGNEMRKITQHLLRDTTIVEETQITKYTPEFEWFEKWGFVNDVPVAYYRRIIE